MMEIPKLTQPSTRASSAASILSVLNPHSMLSLPTWNGIRALTGVFKAFLRRLAEPICDPTSCAQLADTLSEETEEMSKSSLFTNLKNIRLNLIKISSSITSYIEDFLENGPDFSEDFKAYASLKYARSAEEVLGIVKRILESV
ncbi:unnamed protein product [Rodentolepis nana]|uniref:Exocyst subunit Exo70 family protein n=1 Tax=Rodentolepis nana TaxID=102285 RepID=A0A0R3T293_RODNA|nr:unnamed protein product [Rodentolepis nana]